MRVFMIFYFVYGIFLFFIGKVNGFILVKKNLLMCVLCVWKVGVLFCLVLNESVGLGSF